MTQKLGDDFEFNKKACFVYGSLNHLIKDCNFYENKMVGKSVSNNMGRVIGQREVRPVWNNAQRVNHHIKLTHPHPKRNFVPTAVVTKSRLMPVNAAKQSSPSAAASISIARHVNTWKRISEKRMKNQAKTDKTEYEMEKHGKPKVKSKPKSQPRKSQSQTRKSQSSSSIPADYVSAGHVLVSADRDRIC
ncbi:hypothetical protein Tco_0713497 [Tanacetum coccineum]